MIKRLLVGVLVLSLQTCYYHVDLTQRAIYACGDQWQGSNGQIGCILVYQAP